MKGYCFAKNVRYNIKKMQHGASNKEYRGATTKTQMNKKKNIVNRREYIVKINNIATRKVLLRCTRLFYKHFKAALLALFRQFF